VNHHLALRRYGGQTMPPAAKLSDEKTFAAGSQVRWRLHGALRAFHCVANYFNEWLVVGIKFLRHADLIEPDASLFAMVFIVTR
jgi:hypothetical protein